MAFAMDNFNITPNTSGNWHLAACRFFKEESCLHTKVKDKSHMDATIQASRIQLKAGCKSLTFL